MVDINAKIGELIKKRRDELSMSQQELAIKLGITRPAVSQVENGQRKVSADELVKLSSILNMPINQLMGIEKSPQVMLAESTESKEPKEHKISLRINVPQKNIAKFREVLLYILGKVGSKPNIGETVLYKLLYFIDFNFYEKFEEQLIGATYIKNHHGPTPIEFKKVVEKMIKAGEIEPVKSRYFNFPQTKYLPRRKPDLSKIQAHELEMIDFVLNKFSDMNATQISDYSHSDVPWLTAAEGKPIEYESVFYRTPAYSVRDYSEDFS